MKVILYFDIPIDDNDIQHCLESSDNDILRSTKTK